LLTCVGGLGMFLVGMWPLVFNDAPPGEEELEEAILFMIMGIFILFWGAWFAFGASQMHELASYPFALVGSIMGAHPFLVGILYFGEASPMVQMPTRKGATPMMEPTSAKGYDRQFVHLAGPKQTIAPQNRMKMPIDHEEMASSNSSSPGGASLKTYGHMPTRNMPGRRRR